MARRQRAGPSARARAGPGGRRAVHASTTSTTRSRRPEDVARQLKVPFLGLVPVGPRRQAPRCWRRRTCLTTSARRSGRCAPRCSRSTMRHGTKVVLFTSAQPLEGKTTTAVNMAMALAYGGAARAGHRRRHAAARACTGPLRLTNERGLSQVLIGQARVRDVIQRTVDPNLLAITAGEGSAEPVGAAHVGADENAAHEPGRTAHSTGSSSTRRRCSPSPMRLSSRRWFPGVVFVIGAEMTRRRLAERAIGTIMSGPSETGGGRPEQGRFRAQQVLLFALLRPPVQELLRTGGLAPSPVRSPLRR